MQISRPPRVYEPIWKTLRTHKRCVLSVVDARLVPRIKRMIIKEKCNDQGFKLINEIEAAYLRFSWDEEKRELTVLLESKFGLTEVQG
jgi:hypothetical protein